MLFPILTREEGEVQRWQAEDEQPDTASDDDFESAKEEEFTGPITRSRARKLNAKSILTKLDKLVLPAMRTSYVGQIAKGFVNRWVECSDYLGSIFRFD